MDPQRQFDPNQPVQPNTPYNQAPPPAQVPVQQYSQPAQPPVPVNQLESQRPSVPPSKPKRGPLIAIISGVVVGLILIILAVVASLSDGVKTKEDEAALNKNSVSSQVVEPASSLDVNQTNNSIGQDLSRIDDEKDFPSTSLDDKTLGL